jgi:hypothetical protein
MASDDPGGDAQNAARPGLDSCPADCRAHREHVDRELSAPSQLPQRDAGGAAHNVTGRPMLVQRAPLALTYPEECLYVVWIRAQTRIVTLSTARRMVLAFREPVLMVSKRGPASRPR